MAGFNFDGTQLGDLINTAGTNWTGTFGTDSFQPAALIKEPRNTRNAPLNDITNFNGGQAPWVTSTQTDFTFPSIGMPELNRETDFSQSYRRNTLEGQRAKQQQIGGAQELARTAAQNYQQKTAIDRQDRNIDFANQVALLNRQAGFSSPSQIAKDPSIFGMIAQNPRRTIIGSSGMRDLGLDYSKLAENNVLNANNARILAEYSRANQAGNIALSKQEADSQRRILDEQNRNAVNLLNRQTSIDAQTSAINYQRQAEEAVRQRLSQQQLAQIQANASMYGANMNALGNVYGSMFGALSSPGSNYRYWS